MKASIVIRTYNESKHLPALLQAISEQDLEEGKPFETIVVDSGSTDGTLDIANSFGCRLLHISKEEFSFGRSLNMGCLAAQGECLVFISGHCIPENNHWLECLVAPLGRDRIAYSYGGQIGGTDSHFSECQIFAKYFPAVSKIPQEGFYCNNANSALLRSVWLETPFNEEVTGLEDMHLAKLLVAKGMKIAYVTEARVYHLHDETWAKIRHRFEREAIALQYIMPEIHIGFNDFLRYTVSAILLDVGAAMQMHVLRKTLGEIILYRFSQFWGAYRGNQFHRNLSRRRKEMYYYPR